ncbi:rhodanese-like domain-containing protein [Xanthomarina sp. F2636L]|uniref:rhodanese-like domain-containing protein n=1 Tax=Xanthomarina sp. F2636L TaxID=2996018 RepID=UPI00225DCED7|nr:rhodanese-like domain-containing protein [Xanthomarina sp. F2636L]MCX7551890.1 rhodanese-like domain-containing protein [Xanthomarina sp. F2636L]
MKRVVFSILFLVTILGCKETRNENINVVTAEEMQSILELEEVQLVDVRTPEEFSEGFIKDAQNIDFYSDTFDEDILKLDKSKPVILYCKSGRRSASCAEKLIEAGFVKVYDLKGGITQWKHDGLGVEISN